MKKLLIAIIVLFYSFSYAGIYGRIEAGKDVDDKDIYFTTINFGYKFTLWNITSKTYGGWFTWQENNAPFLDTYTIGQSIHFKGFFIEVNHYCNHRVLSDTHKSKDDLWNKYKTNPQALSTVSIGYEFELE
jgi:hypothetical protein